MVSGSARTNTSIKRRTCLGLGLDLVQSPAAIPVTLPVSVASLKLCIVLERTLSAFSNHPEKHCSGAFQNWQRTGVHIYVCVLLQLTQDNAFTVQCLSFPLTHLSFPSHELQAILIFTLARFALSSRAHSRNNTACKIQACSITDAYLLKTLPCSCVHYH